jgi:hypothetical protein
MRVAFDTLATVIESVQAMVRRDKESILVGDGDISAASVDFSFDTPDEKESLECDAHLAVDTITCEYADDELEIAISVRELCWDIMGYVGGKPLEPGAKRTCTAEVSTRVQSCGPSGSTSGWLVGAGCQGKQVAPLQSSTTGCAGSLLLFLQGQTRCSCSLQLCCWWQLTAARVQHVGGCAE